MPTAPTVVQSRTVANQPPGRYGFSSPPTAGNLLLAFLSCTGTHPVVSDWRRLGVGAGDIPSIHKTELYVRRAAAGAADWFFGVTTTGGDVSLVLVEVAGSRAGLPVAAVGDAPVAAGAGTLAGVTLASPEWLPAAGGLALVLFARQTTQTATPGSGWTELADAVAAQAGYVEVQHRTVGPGAVATAATYAASTSFGGYALGCVVLPADDAPAGGPLDLNTWSRGESAGFLRAGGALPVAIAAAVAATGRLVAAEARPVAIAAALSERSDRLRRQLLLTGRITAPLAVGLDLAGAAVDRHTLALAADGAVRARPAAALALGGRVLAARTAALALTGRVVQHAAAALDLAGEVAPYLHYAPALALTGYAAGPVTQALVLAGRTKVASAAALGLGGRVATREAAPLAAEGRVRAGLAAALALSGYAQAPRTAGVGLAGAVRVGQTAALALGGRVAFPRLVLAGRVVQHQARALALAGEVRDYALPPGAPASGYRTRLPWTAQERLRSLT